ncbi:hypothetical protein S83_066439, partial [Arachis hypogaea]
TISCCLSFNLDPIFPPGAVVIDVAIRNECCCHCRRWVIAAGPNRVAESIY